MGAADALGELGDEKAVLPLIQALEDDESSVRIEAAEALGRLNNTSSIAPLIKILPDPEEKVRSEATKALTAIGKPAIESLIVALKDGDNLTQEKAAEALGLIGDERGVEPLILCI